MGIAALHMHRLNYINDFNPESHQFKRPIYAIEPYVTKTGTLDCYKPKGAWDNPTKRNWLKYEVRSSGQWAKLLVWCCTVCGWGPGGCAGRTA